MLLDMSTASGPKLIVRLLPDLNDKLRRRLLYRGDLSSTVAEAINAVEDLEVVPLVNMGRVGEVDRTTTITLPTKTRAKLQKAAVKRGCTMNALVNTAVALWLKKGSGGD
jgi:hypothetical protein